MILDTVVATGLRPILKGDLFYNNWWGGLVFGPMTVVGGLLFLSDGKAGSDQAKV